MGLFEIEIWVGFYILMLMLSFLILIVPGKKQAKVQNDDDIFAIIRDTLEIDELMHYDVISLVSLKETNTTTVIVETDVSEIAVEIDNLTGKVISKEKLII